MANYVSSNTAVPPNNVDQSWAGTKPIPIPNQNFSQHARLLPYIEQTVAFNSINWNYGSRWAGNEPGAKWSGTPNPPDNGAAGGSYGAIQATVLAMTINSFLCPSDPNPGASGIYVFVNGSKVVGSSSYPSNVGMNRRINGGKADVSWQENGPGYLASTWDGIGNRVVTINSFIDGTSNTAIFSEWVKGTAAGLPSKNGLGMVYYFPGFLQSNAFNTDLQFNQACQVQPQNTSQQNWNWKGEWWAYSATMIYSHTVTPNRYACQYADQANDSRATITAVNASSNHPGGINVLFMDGSVRFIKSSVNYLTWYAIATPDGNETFSADSL